MHDIHWLAVLAAATATMVLGALWYSPLLFGKLWVKLSASPALEAGGATIERERYG